ncbi:MAG TPA: DNA adenine methylase [Gemmataceae bacterium]|nr:DNA adenine methylase [Gemmataceae bacterium]
MEAMKIKAIAPWFGGKRTLAPEIVKQLGKHTQYFEPFCGSMAVLFAKEPSQKETVNDLHGDLVNLARVLQVQDQAEDLYDRLCRVLFVENLLRDAVDYLRASAEITDRVERAYWYFIASWFMRNGVAGTQRLEYQIAVRWTKSGGSPTVRWRNALDSMPQWHLRLRNVVILNRDAIEIANRFEDVKETAIYADPPYHSVSRSGYGNHGNGSKYLHEFEHGDTLYGDDHARLRDILAAYKKARIVVSYYDCPRVRELYDGWTFLEKTRQKHLHAQNGRGSRPKEAPEVLIVNGPAY